MSFTSKLATIAAAGSGGDSFWALRIGDSNASVNQLANGITLDSNNNVVICGYDVTANGYIAKIDASGEVVWQKRHSENGSSYGVINGVACDSNDNIYTAGKSSPNFGRGQLAKFNSSGSPQWNKYYNTTYGDDGRAVVVDSSDNIYFAGTMQTSGEQTIIYKTDTSGTIIASKYYKFQDGCSVYEAALNHSEDMIYCAGSWRGTGQTFEDPLLLGVITSSLNDVTNSPAHNQSSRQKWYGVACDSNDNVFVMGNTTGGVTIAKYSQTNYVHTLVNYVCFPCATLTTAGFCDLRIDSNGNVVAVGGSLVNSNFYVFDNDLNLTPIAQRSINGMAVMGMTLDADDNIYLCGEAIGDDDIAVVKLPADYSGLGTYDFFTYAETTNTPTKPSVAFTTINTDRFTNTPALVNTVATTTDATLTTTLTDI